MAEICTPRGFSQPGAYVKDVLNALMSDSGESLSSTISQALLNTNLVAWSIMQKPVSQALEALLGVVAPTMSWRMLSDGTLWIGDETWPTTTTEYIILDRNPTEHVYDFGVDSPSIVPGVTIQDIGRINAVTHYVESNRIRSHVWLDIAEEDRGINAAIISMVKQATSHIDYFAMYDATVNSQSGDYTTVDVTPSDSRLGGMNSVPLRHGLPGCTVQVPSGLTLRVGWDNGDPQKPFAALWNGGESVTRLQLAGNTDAARKGDHSDVGTLTLILTGTTALSGTYVDPDGTSTPVTSGAGIPLKAKITEGSTKVGLG